MATNPNGVAQPAGSDGFDPVYWMQQIVASLHGRIAILAANATARTTLATTCGWTPSPTDPLVVLQTDTLVRWTYDGTTWRSSSHAEFTTSIVGAGNGVLNSSIGTVTNVAGATTDLTFATASAGTIVIAQPGVYALTIAVVVGGTVTGRTFVTVTGGPVVVQQNAFVGEGGLLLAYPNLLTLTASQVLSFQYMQTTGGPVTSTSRIAITKIA
jgi:hypothetical protein